MDFVREVAMGWAGGSTGLYGAAQGRAAEQGSRAAGSKGSSVGTHSYPERGTGRGVLKASAAPLHTQHITGALAGSVRWPQFS